MAIRIKAPFWIVHTPKYVYVMAHAGRFCYGMVLKLVLQYVKA